MGNTEILRQVVAVCIAVAGRMMDVNDLTPYSIKKITRAGVVGFRFNVDIEVSGNTYEVQVKLK